MITNTETINGESITFVTNSDNTIPHNPNRDVSSAIFIAACRDDPRFTVTFDRANLSHPTITYNRA
jgi:hypothetical protein